MLRTVHLVGGWYNLSRRWTMQSHQKHEQWKRAMLALSVTIFVVVQGLLLLEKMFGMGGILLVDVNKWPNPLAIFPRVVLLAYISGRRTSERTSAQWGVVDWRLFHCFTSRLSLQLPSSCFGCFCSGVLCCLCLGLSFLGSFCWLLFD